MHLTALVESTDHVCCRFRLAAFAPLFEQAGHSLCLVRWPRSWWEWLHLLRRHDPEGVTILQRKLPARWQLHLLRRRSRCLLFDFDDAVFLRDSYSAKGLFSARRLGRFSALLGLVDEVVAGNSFLRSRAAEIVLLATRHGRCPPIHVIPTCVEHSRYPLAAHARRQDGVQLVWVGSSSTLRGLEMIRPLLERLGRSCPGIRLKIVCDRFLQLQHLPIDSCPWTEASEPKELAAADIGISWLPDDDWSRGKCGLKVLQYMAAGLPVIANPVGVQSDMVLHGETGLLAETPEQWLEAVCLLAQDVELRCKMGQAGRRRILRQYSVARGAAQWLAILERLQRAMGSAHKAG